MRAPGDAVAVDFETEKIAPRPAYPPRPVGVAIYDPAAGVKEYLAWGHPSGNNCTERAARGRLIAIYRERPVVFHNAEFDLDVGETHLGLHWPGEWHDTLFLAFLDDPRSEELSLKPLAERLLGLRPTEQRRLREWILANVPGATERDWGAYISRAPGDVVAPYAIGDVVRTLRVFAKLRPRVIKLGMGEAYDRERRFLPVSLGMQRRGIRVDVPRLHRARPRWVAQVAELERFIIRRLGGPRAVAAFARTKEGFNIGSSVQLADALEAAGKVGELPRTRKGNRSTKRDVLAEHCRDARLAEALAKRTILEKYLSTYVDKWLEVGSANEGFVFPRINQVRNRDDDAARMTGARTGRLSMSDSWQAIPKPERRPYPDLPNLRDFVIPDEPGQLVLHRDYSQQEYRILAHYEDGPLLARYQADPTIDMHDEAREMVAELTSIWFDRGAIKNTGFGLIYGLGGPSMARKTGLALPISRQLKRAYLRAIPGLGDLVESIKARCAHGEPIRTWGGRLYHVEPPSYSEKFGRVMEYDYKMVNVLIQGSAGDCTKEAMIRADEALRAINSDSVRLLLSVHDEINSLAPHRHAVRAMRLVREAMEGVPFDVLMLSDGAWSTKSWGSLQKIDRKKDPNEERWYAKVKVR